MTSKISLAKLLKESMKRNLAFGAFSLLVYFCYFPVGSLLAIQSYRRYESFDLNREMLFYGAKNPFLLIAACAAAVVLGILQYAYLHSREKTDFYHSFPVRREVLFGIQYTAGLLIWLITYGVNLILFLFVCMANGIAGLALFKAVGLSILAQTSSFLLTYSLMILSMMLTGKVFAAVMGFGTICLYAPSAGGLLNLMMEAYFDTYSPRYGIMNTAPVFLTPVYAIGKLGGMFWEDAPDMQRGISIIAYDLMLGIFLAAVLTALVCVLLYRKRASEAAGKTMAFSAAARAVKFLLVVPVALATQLFLYEATGGSTVWGLFGLLFGLLISSAVIEFVYTMDIREIFRDKKQLLLSAAAALMILAEFRLDLTGYDKWMPSKTEVAEVELEQSSLAYTSRSIYTRVDNGVESWYSWERLADDKWYSTTDLDPVYELLAHSKELSGQKNDSDEEYVYPLLVTWRMQNGAARTRMYTFHEEEMITYFSDICNSEKYRETVYPILKDGETLEELSVLGTDYGYSMQDLTEEQLSTFLDTFKKELRSVTFEERTRGFEIRINVMYRASDGTLYGEEYALLKGAFPETMELLKEYDYEEYGNVF